jgi:hypothetical protein
VITCDRVRVHGDVAGVDRQHAAAGHRVAGVDREVDEVGDPRPDHVAPGEQEQLMGQLGGPLRRLPGLGQVSRGLAQVRGRFRPGGRGERLGGEGSYPWSPPYRYFGLISISR